MPTCSERGWPAKATKDGPKGQRCKGIPLGRLPILPARVHCKMAPVFRYRPKLGTGGKPSTWLPPGTS
eukprot:6558771-Pyramimonas_sp.AAC.1